MVDQMVFKINEIYLFILNYFSNKKVRRKGKREENDFSNLPNLAI